MEGVKNRKEIDEIDEILQKAGREEVSKLC
jgi:hypothetical protein